MPDSERIHEHSPDRSALAEAIVPAAGLLVKDFWESAARLPEPSDFDNGDAAGLWEAILEVRKRKLRMSKIEVQRQLRELGFDENRCFRVIAGAQQQAAYVTLPDALGAVQDLLDRRLRRQATRVLSETLKELPTVHNVQELVQRSERALSDLASGADDQESWTRFADVEEDRTPRLATGIDDLDRVNSGLPIGELTIVAARASVGKTGFGVTLMRNVAHEAVGVACFSLEMRNAALIHRMAALEAYRGGRLASGRSPNPYYDEYERGIMDADMLQRFMKAKAVVQALPIFSDDRRGRSLNHIRTGARRAKALFEREGRELQLIVVDHIGKVRPERQRDRHIELGDTTEELAAIAAELKVAMVGLCQINREAERSTDRRPHLHQLSESGRIEQDAHTIMLLHRPGRYDELAKDRGEEPDEKDQRRIAREKFLMEVDFAKNRGGAIKRVPLFCEIGANAILSKDDKRCAVNAMGGEL